jgi:hypothetical protein
MGKSDDGLGVVPQDLPWGCTFRSCFRHGDVSVLKTILPGYESAKRGSVIVSCCEEVLRSRYSDLFSRHSTEGIVHEH